MLFHSKEFRSFANAWNFQIVTSSPTYHGLVEHNVQKIKRLFKKSWEEGKDVEMVLLEFWNTSITGLDASPAQLLISWHLRSVTPTKITCHASSLCQWRSKGQTWAAPTKAEVPKEQSYYQTQNLVILSDTKSTDVGSIVIINKVIMWVNNISLLGFK